MVITFTRSCSAVPVHYRFRERLVYYAAGSLSGRRCVHCLMTSDLPYSAAAGCRRGDLLSAAVLCWLTIGHSPSLQWSHSHRGAEVPVPTHGTHKDGIKLGVFTFTEQKGFVRQCVPLQNICFGVFVGTVALFCTFVGN